MLENDDLSALAQVRSQGYWLLSRLFLTVPNAQNLRALQAELAGTNADNPLDALRRAVEESLRAPDEAAVEFTRRLVVVSKSDGESLPYESFFREGTVPGAKTAEVAACMADCGFFNIAPDAPSPDHIGAELRFMALLSCEESQAWKQDRRAEAMRLVAAQHSFLNGHLAAWAIDYCEALESRAEHSYMKLVARMAGLCLLEDVAIVEENFRELSGAIGVAVDQEPVR
ncbi:MAG TPA: molecular chaperone TorD family protein [Noviherbaspirillum sp.]|uniref:TorD/DmsD family molecular chaperone n=1 Tax=Noviherbaspirillum sp. TaxID=1926288 RepID=UPI002B478132|nr:molecular chaperone TorD family protein [Noviherbaspirillum sp.]HJV88389.1 molecular chaperone TorD family protein [Noviherbaspirillum sp.]